MVKIRKTEINLRRFFQNILFWVVLMYFVQAVVIGVLFKENGRTTKALIRSRALEQDNKLKIEASASAVYNTCLAGIPVSIKVNTFANGVLAMQSTLVTNSQASIDATPKTDPTYKSKVENLKRLKKTAPAIKAIHFPVATKKDCEAKRAAALVDGHPTIKVPKGAVKSSSALYVSPGFTILAESSK